MGKARKTQSETQRTLLGKRFLFVGNGNQRICETCGVGRKRGMMSSYEDKSFCNESCVVRHVRNL